MNKAQEAYQKTVILANMRASEWVNAVVKDGTTQDKKNKLMQVFVKGYMTAVGDMINK